MNLNISNMTKNFKSLKALDNVNLNIEQGVFGLLGPNGAGKTTMMRILAGLLEANSGEVTLDNQSLSDGYTVRKLVSYLPQEFSFYPNMTVEENLNYMAVLADIKDKKYRKKLIHSLMDKVNLNAHKKKKAKALSGGMNRRLGIAVALLKDPKVLIVDEPTAGLDPKERIRLRNLLLEFSKERIVILSTHIVEDVTSTCQSIGMIDQGVIRFNDSIETALQLVADKVFSVAIKMEELAIYRQQYQILKCNPVEGGYEIRILSDKKEEHFTKVNQTLEDAYMYILSTDEQDLDKAV